MRELDTALICQTVADMVVQANCCIGADVMESLRQGRDREEKPLARSILDKLIRNDEIAARRAMPLCQDTGMAVFRVRLGQELHIVGQPLEEALQQGMAQGYREGYLRKSVVRDPVFHRENTGDNTPAVIYYEMVPGDRLELFFAPKGFGSENMSRIAMLKPSDGIEGVKKFVVDTVKAAGSSPCPPMVVGVGIGGTLELAGLCAKRAAMRDVDTRNPDPRYAAFEEELLGLLNDLGTGPQGLGGATTAFKVNVEFCATHIASLPVAVNINCHAARHAEAEL